MIDLKEIFKRAVSLPSDYSITIPGPTDEERNKWQASLLVSSMAIDSRYVAISRKDLELFQARNLYRFWKGSESLAKTILDFNPTSHEKGFYLHAEPGLGKTSILKTLAIRLAKRFPGQVIFTQLKQAIDAMAEDDFSYKAEIHRKLVSCRFLFIDDLGVERSTEWTREQIYAVLDRRLHAFTPSGEKMFTFFSSNLTVDQLLERYHSRDVRRIFELATVYNI